jgi:hypothetical protein
MKLRNMTVIGSFVLAAGWMAVVPSFAVALTQGELKGFRQAVRAHVQEQSEEEDGAFVVRDEKLDKEWRLKLIRLRDEVRQVSEKAYSVCADFKEVDGRTKLDVDFLVNHAGSGWVVRQTTVHAVGGKPRVAQAAAAPPLKKPEAGGAVFICTMGDYSGPRTPDGRCPKCGMNLIEKK